MRLPSYRVVHIFSTCIPFFKPSCALIGDLSPDTLAPGDCPAGRLATGPFGGMVLYGKVVPGGKGSWTVIHSQPLRCTAIRAA